MTTPRNARVRHAVEGYLRRLGVGYEPPSVEALRRLHAATVEHVPYETFWLHLGQGWDVDAVSALERVAFSGRGGYCFHLNGSLAVVLEHLGYRVTRHVAGVHDDAGPATATLGNHVALVVHGLATVDSPSGEWYVDAGLGDVLYEPLPLTRGRSAQGHLAFTVDAVEGGGVGDWHVAVTPAGSLAGVSVAMRTVTLDRFRQRHTFNATSSQSSFARTVTAQRRHRLGADVMRGCVLTQREGDAIGTDTFTSQREWTEALADVFGLHRLDRPPALTALWQRVQAAHQQWLDRAAHGIEVAA